MKLLLGGKRSGKTTKLIRLSAATEAVLVVSSHVVVGSILDSAKYLGLSIPKPITFHAFVHSTHIESAPNGYLIDDLYACMQSVSSSLVQGISICSEAPELSLEVSV